MRVKVSVVELLVRMEVNYALEQLLLRSLEPPLIAMVGASWSLAAACTKLQCWTILGCFCTQQPTACTEYCTLLEHRDPPFHLSASTSSAPKVAHLQMSAENVIPHSE